MIEAAYTAWFIGIGAVAASVAAKHLGVWGMVLSSPLIGAGIYSLVAAVLVGFATFDTVLALTLSTVVAVTAVAASRIIEHRWPPQRETGLALGLATGTAIVVSFALQSAHLTRMTPDSVEYLTVAGSLQRFGVLAPFPSDILLRRQMTTGALHTVGVLTGSGYFPTLTFLLTASGIGLTAWLGNRSLRMFAVPMSWRWAIAGSATFALFATNRVVYNLFYINSHGSFAGFLLIAVGFSWYAVTAGRWSLVAPAALGFAALVPLRADGVAVAVIFLVPIVTAAVVPVRVRWALTAPLALTVIGWYGVVLHPYLPAAEYRPTAVAGSYVLVAAGLVLLVAVSQAPAAARVVRWAPWLVSGILAAYVAWHAHDGFANLIRDLGATGSNIGAYGLWAGFWWAAPLLVAVALAVVTVPNQRFFVPGLLTFPLALLAFAYLRGGPYRVGTGDSANRMLMHVVFVLVVYIVSAAGVAYREAFGDETPDGGDETPYPRGSSSNTTAAGSTA